MSAKVPLGGEGEMSVNSSKMRVILVGVLIFAIAIFIVPKFLGGSLGGSSITSVAPAMEETSVGENTTAIVDVPPSSKVNAGGADAAGGVFDKFKTMAGGALPSAVVENNSSPSVSPPVSSWQNEVSVGGSRGVVGCSCGKPYGCKGSPPTATVCYHTTVAGIWYCPGDVTPSGFRCIGPAWGK